MSENLRKIIIIEGNDNIDKYDIATKVAGDYGFCFIKIELIYKILAWSILNEIDLNISPNAFRFEDKNQELKVFFNNMEITYELFEISEIDSSIIENKQMIIELFF